ncbi:XAP5, circadian clock regulator-domain-containing protein [Thermothelomyces heterothallicus CBS 202.75]|uniref:XAP5, circadian clock regulator-domain-containing protein n=1 Tax=Thermothelomyces heterothallicus CBS 202.75 TaxID=1149848 RepID=UPI0037441FAB
MSDRSLASSRFTPQNQATNDRLSINTVGLVALSDFRKRRAEVLEQQEREAREAALSARTNTSTPDRSLTATPNNASADSSETEKQRKKKKKKHAKALVSFGDDDEEEEDESGPKLVTGRGAGAQGAEKAARQAAEKDVGDSSSAETGTEGASGEDRDKDKDKDKADKPPAKVMVNSSVGIVPRARTKAALRREAAEREALRKEFLMLQAAVKATEIAIPFVFYDGTNIPGGIVRVKKGDFVWFFLDKSRKVGARLGVGADKVVNARRDWARVSVDDLLLVRGTIIIPHHYEFYFFIINKTIGPGNKLLFDYSAEATPTHPAAGASGTSGINNTPDLSKLEGASDDPTFTKVVDRRWYQRNKHIYPASVWQVFDPEKDYSKEIPRDPGGNAFFFTR